MPTINNQTVVSKTQDGKAISLTDGNRYSVFSAIGLQNVNVGDVVSFEYIEKPYNGKIYFNIKGGVRVSGSAPIPMTSQTGSGGAYARAEAKPGDPPLHTQRCIIRQSCLKAAVDYCIHFPSGDGFEGVITIAKEFEAYCTGDEDQAAVKAELGITD